MSMPINGFNVSLPLDLVARVFAKIRYGGGPVSFRRSARYQLNGEWFTVEQVLSNGLILRCVDPKAAVAEERW